MTGTANGWTVSHADATMILGRLNGQERPGLGTAIGTGPGRIRFAYPSGAQQLAISAGGVLSPPAGSGDVLSCTHAGTLSQIVWPNVRAGDSVTIYNQSGPLTIGGASFAFSPVVIAAARSARLTFMGAGLGGWTMSG